VDYFPGIYMDITAIEQIVTKRTILVPLFRESSCTEELPFAGRSRSVAVTYKKDARCQADQSCVTISTYAARDGRVVKAGGARRKWIRTGSPGRWGGAGRAASCWAGPWKCARRGSADTSRASWACRSAAERRRRCAETATASWRWSTHEHARPDSPATDRPHTAFTKCNRRIN